MTVVLLQRIGALTGIVTVPDDIAQTWIADGRARPYPDTSVEETAAVAVPVQRPRHQHATGELR